MFGRALVVGIVRNVELTFEKDFFALSKALSFFDRVNYYVIESDSSDCTIDVLKKIKLRNINFEYKSLGDLKKNLIEDRIERITYCRNKYLDYFFDNRKNFDYLVVADMDGVNIHITKEAVLSSFSVDVNWDAVFANQSALYYDIWALRQDGWCPADCWENYEFLKKMKFSDRRARWDAIYSKMIKVPEDAGWISVRSAFGGLGIYNANSFPNEYYSCKDKYGNQICEHVGLHLSSGFANAKMYINPKMINGGLNGHSEKALLRKRLVVEFKKVEKTIRNFKNSTGIRLSFGSIKRKFR